MIKQWINKTLNINYFFVPSKINTVLTSDGVLLDYGFFKNLTPENYNKLKLVKSLYNYNESRETGNLVFKEVQENKPVPEAPSENTAPATPVVPVVPAEVTNPVEKEKVEDIPDNSKIKKVFTRKVKINFINLAERFIMLIVSLMACTLSIYYTRAYLMRTNSAFFATILSTSMLLYSLIGLQMVGVLKKQKRYFISIVFLVTSLTTTGFSMFTSLDVNMTNYLKNNKIEMEQEAVTDRNAIILQNLKEQEQENRKTADTIKKDIDYYTERKLNTYTQRQQLEKLNNDYTSLKQREIDLMQKDATAGIQSVKGKNEMSLIGIIAKATKSNKDILQMLIMIFASVFIDVIAPLSLNVFIYGKEK